jgi:hypothetical protein
MVSRCCRLGTCSPIAILGRIFDNEISGGTACNIVLSQLSKFREENRSQKSCKGNFGTGADLARFGCGIGSTTRFQARRGARLLCKVGPNEQGSYGIDEWLSTGGQARKYFNQGKSIFPSFKMYPHDPYCTFEETLAPPLPERQEIEN